MTKRTWLKFDDPSTKRATKKMGYEILALNIFHVQVVNNSRMQSPEYVCVHVFYSTFVYVYNFCTYGGRRHTVFDCCVTIVRDTQILTQTRRHHRKDIAHAGQHTKNPSFNYLAGGKWNCVPYPSPIIRVRLFTVYRTNKYSTAVLATRTRV